MPQLQNLDLVSQNTEYLPYLLKHGPAGKFYHDYNNALLSEQDRRKSTNNIVNSIGSAVGNISSGILGNTEDPVIGGISGAVDTGLNFIVPGLGTASSIARNLGNIAGDTISNGYSNNTIDTIRNVTDPIPIVNTAVDVLGGIGNRLFGSKINQDYINTVNNDINNIRDWRTNATSWTRLNADLNNIPTLNGVSKSKVGSDGIWSNNAAAKEYNKLNNKYNSALDVMGNRIKRAEDNIYAFNTNSMSKNYLNNYAAGGNLFTNGLQFNNGLSYINTGNTHENNPYEGVPVSINQQDGEPNLVEEGEVIANNEYVFSNRLKVPDDVAKHLSIPRGKTFADAIKLIAKESEELPNDPIIKKGLEHSKNILRQAQEQIKAINQQEEALNQQKIQSQNTIDSLLGKAPEIDPSMLEQQEEQNNSQEDLDALLANGSLYDYANGGKIHIKEKNKGKFTESANRAGMGVQEYASHILANPDNYSSTLVKRANFARNAAKWKHAEGGHYKKNKGGNLFADGGKLKWANGEPVWVVGQKRDGTEIVVPVNSTFTDKYGNVMVESTPEHYLAEPGIVANVPPVTVLPDNLSDLYGMPLEDISRIAKARQQTSDLMQRAYENSPLASKVASIVPYAAAYLAGGPAATLADVLLAGSGLSNIVDGDADILDYASVIPGIGHLNRGVKYGSKALKGLKEGEPVIRATRSSLLPRFKLNRYAEGTNYGNINEVSKYVRKAKQNLKQTKKTSINEELDALKEGKNTLTSTKDNINVIKNLYKEGKRTLKENYGDIMTARIPTPLKWVQYNAGDIPLTIGETLATDYLASLLGKGYNSLKSSEEEKSPEDLVGISKEEKERKNFVKKISVHNGKIYLDGTQISQGQLEQYMKEYDLPTFEEQYRHNEDGSRSYDPNTGDPFINTDNVYTIGSYKTFYDKIYPIYYPNNSNNTKQETQPTKPNNSKSKPQNTSVPTNSNASNNHYFNDDDYYKLGGSLFSRGGHMFIDGGDEDTTPTPVANLPVWNTEINEDYVFKLPFDYDAFYNLFPEANNIYQFGIKASDSPESSGKYTGYPRKTKLKSIKALEESPYFKHIIGNLSANNYEYANKYKEAYTKRINAFNNKDKNKDKQIKNPLEGLEGDDLVAAIAGLNNKNEGIGLMNSGDWGPGHGVFGKVDTGYYRKLNNGSYQRVNITPEQVQQYNLIPMVDEENKDFPYLITKRYLLEDKSNTPTNTISPTTSTTDTTKNITNPSNTTLPPLEPLPYENDMLRYAPLGFNTGSLLYNLRPTDYRAADEIDAASRLNPISLPTSHISDYRRRNPFDESYLANLINQNAAANARASANYSGGNRAMQLGSLAARDYALNQALGQLGYQSYLANRTDDESVAAFNRATNQYNADIDNNMNLQLANINNNREQFTRQNLINNAAYRQSLRDQRDVAIANDLQTLSNNLSGLGKEAYDRNHIIDYINWGILPTPYGRRTNSTKETKKTKKTKKDIDSYIPHLKSSLSEDLVRALHGKSFNPNIKDKLPKKTKKKGEYTLPLSSLEFIQNMINNQNL